MDALEMTFDSNTFDIVIEKGIHRFFPFLIYTF